MQDFIQQKVAETIGRLEVEFKEKFDAKPPADSLNIEIESAPSVILTWSGNKTETCPPHAKPFLKAVVIATTEEALLAVQTDSAHAAFTYPFF